MKNFLILLCSLFSFSFLGCKQASQNEKGIQISPEDLKETLQNEGIQLVDVRTSKEFNSGHIKGATNINYFSSNFGKQIQEILDKEKPVYIYCRSGKRSGKSIKHFKESGFKKVYDLKGGFLNWKEKGFEAYK